MPNWKKVIVSGSDAILSDVTIDDWGSVSASLSSVATSGSSLTLQQVTDNSPYSGEAITTDTIWAGGFKTNDVTGTINAGRYFSRINGGISQTGMDLASGISTHPSASIAFRLGGAILPIFLERNTAGPRSFNTIFNRFSDDNTIEIWASGSGKTLEIESTGLGGENTVTTIHSGRTILKTDSHGVAGDTSKLFVQGNVSSSDAYINGWGSVSASLSAVNQGLGGVTLQQVTSTGNTTTDDIIVNGGDITVTGSVLSTDKLYASRGIVAAYSDNIAFTGAPGYTAGYGGLASLDSSYFTGTYFPRYNVAIGTDVLEFVTASNSSGGMQGSFNTAVGAFAMEKTTIGRRNVSIGLNTMVENLSGDDNVAIGESALFENTSQDRNTAVGARSLYSLGSGEYNAGLGYLAIASLATGSNNIGIGNNAGYLSTTAENSTFIGYRSRPEGDGQTNQIVIGHDATGHGSNTVTIGNSSTTDNYFSGNISGSDVQIDDWGSVSASLASLTDSSAQTLQQVTDNGATTTNTLEIGGLTGSGDFLIEKTLPTLVLNNQGSVPSVDGYGSYIILQTDQWNSGPVGSPMATIIATDGNASHKGSISFEKATTNLSDIKFYNTNYGSNRKAALNISSSGDLFSSGSISGSDVYINDWGSLSASLANIDVVAGNNLYTSNGTLSSNRTVNGGSNSLSFTNLSSFSVSNSPISLEGPLYLGANVPAATGSALDNTLYIDTVSGEVKYGSSPTLDSVTGNGSTTTNDISIGSLTVGSGENITFTGDAALQTNNNSFTLDADVNADGAGFIDLRTSNVTRAQVNNTGLTVTGDLDADDVTIDEWGSISASLASIEAGATTTTLQEVTDNGSTTTNPITISGSNASLTLTGSNTIETDYSTVFSSKKTCPDSNITTLFSASISTYVGAVVNYTLYDASKNNMRTGTVTAVSNTTATRHSEVVTTDIGDTNNLEIGVVLVSPGFGMRVTNNSGASFNAVYSVTLLKE